MNRKLRRAMKAIGLNSKNTNPVNADDIQKQYHMACAQAGDMQYRMEELKRVLKDKNEEIRKLNTAYSEYLAQQTAEATPSKAGAGEASASALPSSEAK